MEKRMKNPCYSKQQPECPDRRQGCHAECPRWAEFEAHKAEVYRARKEHLDAMMAIEEGHRKILYDWLRKQKR